MTPDEWIRYARREHSEVAYPVAHCRKDHQNWPCDAIRGIEAGAAAERASIAKMATDVGATVPKVIVNGEAMTSVPFADLIAEGEPGA